MEPEAAQKGQLNKYCNTDGDDKNSATFKF